MSEIIHSDWYWYANKGWRINSRKSGSRIDILKCLLSQLSIMLERDSKVFMFRFDLRLAGYTDDNRCITNFNRRLFKRIKRHYKSTIGFAWVREIERSKKQHYHYVLLLEGHKIRHPATIQKWIQEIWNNYDGTPHWSGYANLHREDETSIQKTVYWISYLAKPRGKGSNYRPAQTKDYGSSRLKSVKPTK